MRLSAVLACGFLAAGLAAMPPANAASKPDKIKPDRILETMKTIAPMEFFVAKGGPNACGVSCDSWIAAEGLIDNGAVARLRRVLDRLGGRKLPIFFYSPGGDTAQGLAIGRMLRERGLSAGVAVTVPAGCMQAHEVEECSALMRQPQPPEAALLLDGAACSSACAYAILGAVKREIAPTARLGVHAGYSYLSFADPEIGERQRTQAIERGKRRIARDVQRYLDQMGIDRELFKLASETKFESLHFLTRAELFDLGVDRREVADSGWHFSDLRGSSLGASMLTTLIEKDTVEPTGFTQMALAISCGAGPSSYKVSTIALVPDPATGASQTDIRIAGDPAEMWLPADSATRRTTNGKTYEIRAAEWPRPLVEKLLRATPAISFVEAKPHIDDGVRQHAYAAAALPHPLSGLGTENSLKTLASRCAQSD